MALQDARINTVSHYLLKEALGGVVNSVILCAWVTADSSVMLYIKNINGNLLLLLVINVIFNISSIFLCLC